MTNQENNFVLSRWDRKIHQQTQTKIQHDLWPSAEDFYHPWNPTFGFYFTTEAHLEIYPMLLLRDGAQGLLDFFLRFPLYYSNFSKLAVHADLSFLIPESWKQHTYLYRMEPFRRFEAPTQNIIIYALTSYAFLNWPALKTKLDDWIELNIPPSSKVSVYFSQREELYDNISSDRMAGLEILSKLQHHLTSKIEILSLPQFKRFGDDREATFIHLDLWRSSVALCSIDSFMQSRLSQVLPVPRKNSESVIILTRKKVSLNHEIILYRNDSERSEFSLLQDYHNNDLNHERLPLSLLSKILTQQPSK